MAKQPLQTLLQLEFNHVNVTDDLLPDLLSFQYDDKESDEADEVSITLKDPDGKWAGSWRPEGGESVQAWIIEGRTDGIGPEIYCGEFFVDSLSVAGPPRTMQIQATSIPLNKPIRKQVKNRAWEKQTIFDIASTISGENEVPLQFYVDKDVTLDRQNQERESDLQFLSRLCKGAGFSLKVSNSAIIIFDKRGYEAMDPVKTFTLGESDILGWSFENAQSETYKACKVTYRDPKKKKKTSAGKYDFVGAGSSKTKENPAVSTYTYTDPDVGESGQVFTLKTRASSIDEAKRLARAKLRELNQRSVTGSLSVIGDVGLAAGQVIAVKGFGSFDGNFIIEQASHKVDTGGYTTELTLRRANNKY